ncbi:hypothetical protein ACFVT5_17450 [Streptomyces sp. NPDC058001]|uniref:hypothetical protein n=1 Tax=Streptomyces sp. NPDC058001 TaxID=3346300 RepID=UPI0036DFDD92
MRRVARRALGTVLAGLALAGCFGPGPSRGWDGESVPEESSRTALPVAPAPDGRWALTDMSTRLLGQGRTLVRLPDSAHESGSTDESESTTDRAGRGWRLTLPEEFALTSRQPGTPHSALTFGMTTVLVGGDGRGSGATAVAGVDLEAGTLTWRHQLPAHTRVFLPHDTSTAVAVAVTCGAEDCRLTGWNSWSGRREWTRTVKGPVRVLDSCQADALVRDEDSVYDYCLPYLVTGDRVGTVGVEDGAVHWEKGLKPPAGTVDRIGRWGDRTVLVTAPAKGTCRATVLAGAAASVDGDRGRRWDIVWDQPQAPRDPATGCRWDRRIPLVAQVGMVLPDKEGARIIAPDAGNTSRGRLAPGEYLVPSGGGGGGNLVVRAAGRADRPLHGSDPVRPKGLGPDATVVSGNRFWQDGRRLVLFGYDGKMLWETTSDCQAFAPVQGSPVTYCDGGDLVEVVPAQRD